MKLPQAGEGFELIEFEKRYDISLYVPYGLCLTHDYQGCSFVCVTSKTIAQCMASPVHEGFVTMFS